MICPFKKSNVKVDDDAMTKDERVLMDAAKTNMIIIPTITSGKFESMAGIIESKTMPLAPVTILSEFAYNRPKLPRK
jgi:hypothetical protein